MGLIPYHISLNLCFPEFRQPCFQLFVFVAMPKITVNKNRQLSAWKNNIRLSWQCFQVFPESKPTAVELRPDNFF